MDMNREKVLSMILQMMLDEGVNDIVLEATVEVPQYGHPWLTLRTRGGKRFKIHVEEDK